MGRPKRSEAEEETHRRWWDAGHSLAGRTSTKPENQGLSAREQTALEEENNTIFGGSGRKPAIVARGKAARRRR